MNDEMELPEMTLFFKEYPSGGLEAKNIGAIVLLSKQNCLRWQ